MDYKKAKDLRGKSFSERMTENLISGSGIGESFKKTLSEKSKARMMGIKESFDPLNIAKKLTGGSRLGPALLGKMMGRSKEDLQYFAGDPKKQRLNRSTTTGLDPETLKETTESLGKIYDLLKKDKDNKVNQREKKEKFLFEQDTEEELRNQELIKALTARRKKTPKEKRKEEVKEKEAERKEKKQEAKAPEKPPAKAPEKPPAKAPEKPPAKAPEKPPAKAPAKAPEKPPAKAPAKAPEKPPTAAPAPKPEVKPPTAAPAPKPEVKPPTATPAAKPEVKPPTAAPAAKPPIIGTAAGKLGGAAGLVVSALVSSGIVSSKAQANVLSQVKSESNFVPKSESLFYTKAEGIQGTFGKGRIPTLEFAQQFVSKKGDDKSEQLANHVYAKTDGNSAPGDGWKYRGRGFLQITGKNAYKSLGDYLNVDLVSNPDLLNSPEIAAKSIPWFFLNYKKNLTKGDPKSLEDIGLVNKAVGFADDKVGSKAKKRAELASEIQSMDLNSGSQIDQASKENKDLKADIANKDKAPIIVNNNTTNTQGKASAPTSSPADDRPAYMKKAQGQ